MVQFFNGYNIIRKLEERPRLFSLLKFIVKFNILSIPLYIFILFNIEFIQLQLATASIVHYLLGASGVPSTLDGISITIPLEGGYWSARIIWDCIGWKSVLFFLALVFATSFSLRKKKLALLFIPAIVFVNIARIWFMFYYVYTNGLSNYEALHALVWSWGMIITVLALWIIWLLYASRNNIYQEK